MSASLTATVNRPSFSFQGAISPTLPAFIYPPDSEAAGQRDDGPAAKRRRVVDDGAAASRGPKRGMKDCLSTQITGGIAMLLDELPAEVYLRNEIALSTISSLATLPVFRTRVDETNGYLTAGDVQYFLAWARQRIGQLSESKRFKVLPAPNFNRSPPTEPTKATVVNLEESRPVRESPQTREVPPVATPTSLPKPSTQSRKLEERPLQPRRRNEARPNNKWFQLSQRPYRAAADRDAIAKGAKHLVKAPRGVASQPTVYHVDFTADEIAQVLTYVSSFGVDISSDDSLDFLARLCRILDIPTLVGNRLEGRSVEDVRTYCSDLMAGHVSSSEEARVLSFSQDADNQRRESARTSRIPSLLLAREIEGNIGFGRMRKYENFQNEFKKAREDGLQLVAEFTNCAGDITAGSWVSETNVVCGTTAHSDTHNQQYNKPGNLLLCSTSAGTLRAFPDHRIPRPVVLKGENSTEAMRQSQDPWLYSSVVSSDYDKVHDIAYTSSFDKTVKAWKVDDDGKSMKALATWQHSGNVNFVAAAKDGSGRVATAADTPVDAVRVYTVNPNNPAESSYTSLSCSRTDANDSDKWAYYPATLQWGRAPGSHHLLLVGWSPRSLSGDDHEIPEDKRKSGEITLWDANEGRRVPVMTASSANVFEVTWHPTLLRFIVATTPISLSIEQVIRTQIHIFQRDWDRPDVAYSQFQTLDCTASDINELTFMPNSVRHAYITAACTDGRVYVWDTAQGDNPVHVLQHGIPLEEFVEDREREDTGVKFTAWGASPDRFYTGASDGVVKVWNVRKKHKPLVRNLVETAGPISFGAFSPDNSKLAVGDATGRVFVFSVDKRDEHQSHFITLPGGKRKVRRSKPLIPHSEPPPPEAHSDDIDADSDSERSWARRHFLDSAQLQLSGNPVIGAVQGPRYETTGLFRRDAHLNNDPELPLLAEFERNQRYNTKLSKGSRRRSLRRLRNPGDSNPKLEAVHEDNQSKDLNLEDLPDSEMEELKDAWALLDIEEDWGFDYEEMP